jgi:hypothetical protein
MFEIPDGAPLPDPDEYRTKNKKVKKIVLYKPGDGTELKQVKGDTIELNNSEPEWDAIEEFINKHSMPIYKNICVTKIKTNVNRGFFIVLVSGEYSRYCHNISREHSSNNIWFYIWPDGMVQKCTDNQEDPEMKYGVCCKYSSATIPLTHEIQNVLFKKNGDVKIQTEHENIKDKKLKMLLIMGNELCKSLFHSSWTLEDENGELLLSNQNQKKCKKDLLLGSMEDTLTSTYTFSKSRGDEMGTKCSEILLKLGFINSEDKKHRDSIVDEEEDSIYSLETQAFESLRTYVEIVCMMNKNDLQTFTNFNYLDAIRG